MSGPPGQEEPARIPRPRKQAGPAGSEPRGRPRRQRPSPPPRRPRPHKEARTPKSKRRRQPPPLPPSSTEAVSPAPTRRSDPLPSPPRRPRRYRSRRPSPTAEPARASAPPPLRQPLVPETPPPQTGQPPRSSMGAGVREAAFTTFPDSPRGSPALPPETRAELGVRSGSGSGSRSPPPPPPPAATLPPLPPRRPQDLNRQLCSAVELPAREH
ncbi:basic proline-rich protein-like [Enhydra lutris kenyoni]|uniref:Basic proline-rich protein-like n=1 Tax=Enhydra lutris kenyoni TaxID=391180 RepID=A0A2Y9KMI4_ENHLU|nr:basic proline-rich protein-like [Enhydra lutris kenyoni]